LLNLSDTQLVAKGRDRACYEHPNEKELCIKVALKPEKQSVREKKYLEYLTKNNRDLSGLSNFRGEIDTNLGKGYMFDLIRDTNGKVALTLNSSIQQKLINLKEAEDLICQFASYLRREQICAYDLSPNNLVIFQDEQNNWQARLIDGLGVSKPNPFITRIAYFTKKLQDHAYSRLKRKTKLAFTSLESKK
jgi:hypothetical protein